MKTGTKWIVALTCVGLMTGVAMAQNSGQWGKAGSRDGHHHWNSQMGMNRGNGHMRFCDSKHLLDRQVTNEQGKKLGRIRDVIFSQQSGRAYVAIGVRHGRWAVVPMQALKMTGARRHVKLTLHATPQALRNGPTVAANHWRRSVSNPNFIRRVDRRYNFRNMEMGGAGNEGMTGRGHGMGRGMGMNHHHMGMGQMGGTNRSHHKW